MSDNGFDRLERELQSGGAPALFELLARQFRAEKKYPLLFETRLMQKRHELGLPLVQLHDSLADVPEAARPAYERAFLDAARETGSLFLDDGDIPRAWPYFRAVGDPAAVAAAIERVEPGEGIDRIVEIAFAEGVHPRKGFELILAQYGMCRAITCFSQFPAGPPRTESLRLLVRTLHAELLAALKRAVAQAEGSEPQGASISALVDSRDWLFADNAYYIDSTHVASVVQFSIELEDAGTLALALELTDYGRRLAPMFQFRGDPPFEEIYPDHAVYLRALLGRDVDQAIAHFRAKLDADESFDAAPAQALVSLLARLRRYGEAIEISLQHLAGVEPARLACPTAPQLCQMAGEYRRLMDLARRGGDLLSFAAAALQCRTSAAADEG